MTHHYPEIWAALSRAGQTEKTASYSADASVTHAMTASGAFELFMSKAASYGETDSASGAAKAAAAFGYDLVESAAATRTKVASAGVAGRSLERLATVAFVDRVLGDAMAKTAGDESEKLAHMRALGREFAVEILRSLVV
jgi:hypothetical protein